MLEIYIISISSSMSSSTSPGFRLAPRLLAAFSALSGSSPSQSKPSSLNLKLHSRPVNGTFRKLGEKILKNLCVPNIRYKLSLIVSNLSLASFLSVPRPLYLRNSMVVLPKSAWNQFQQVKRPITIKHTPSSMLKNVINFWCCLNK